MKRFILPVIVFILLIGIGGLSWRVHKLSGTVASVLRQLDSSYLTYYSEEPEPFYEDIRGIYTYPEYGGFILPNDSSVNLTMAVFMSAAQECNSCLNEFETLKRLDSVFESRGQRMYAISTPEDSIKIESLLKGQGLDVPLRTFGDMKSGNGFVFEKLGFSKFVTPVKILFDSSMTAIYMRGADNSLESQQVFEKAALNLSEMAMEGKL